ncbi:metallophosphoesterase family protein [Stetteria hydrogenophila]
MVVLAAFADVHSPVYLGLLRSALAGAGFKPCAVLFAGDLVDKGRAAAAEPVASLLREKWPGIPVVAVPGNEDYEEVMDEIKRRTPGFKWLEDEYTVVDCGGEAVAVVGTRGALDRLTRWQRRHKPHLERVYRERPQLIARLIDEARREAGRVVLLSHYALARATLRGEDPRIWPELYSSRMERVVAEKRPDAAVHGHAHKGTPRALVAGVPVYNVALPLNRRIVEVELRPRGLEAFL